MTEGRNIVCVLTFMVIGFVLMQNGKKVKRMSDLFEWYENRWECIERGIDIPLFDYVICSVSVPVLLIGFIVAVITSPIWGIPYVIYRVRQWKNE